MTKPGHPDTLLPLTHLTYHVLLAMADGPRHGYGMIQEVERRTDGLMQIEAGTLYAAIKRMVEEGLIMPADDDGSRRRNYELTDLGRSVLAAESERLAKLLEIARDKNVLPAAPLGSNV